MKLLSLNDGPDRCLALTSTTARRTRGVEPGLNRLARLLAVCMACATLVTPLLAQDPLEVLWTQEGKGSGALAFSPDGRWLAAAQDGVQVRRVADGTWVRAMSSANSDVMSLAFSPDSLQLASGDGNGVIRIHNVWDGSLAWNLTVAGDVTQVAYAPGRRLASWSSDQRFVSLWQADTGQLSQSYSGFEWSHYNVAFSPDGTLAALGGDTDPTIKLVSVTDASVVRVLAGHTARVRSVVFCADGATLVSAGDDGSIRIWRVGDGALLRSLSGHTNGVWKVAVAPNFTLASTGNDGTLRLWRMTDGALLRTYLTGLGASISLEFSPDGSAFAFERSGAVVMARNPVPAITSQPMRRTRFAGQTASFTVSATGDGPLSYQWKHDGIPINGATSDTLILPSVAPTDGGLYTVRVSNVLGAVESRPVDLTVLDRPMGPGSLDIRFDPSVGGEQTGFGGGVPGIRAAVEEPDGRLVVGGFFGSVNGTVRRHLARLQPDGTVDGSFQPGFGFDGDSTALARQPDGAILVGGYFSAADGRPQGGLVRVDRAGKLDPAFQVTLSNATYRFLAPPTAIAVQRDGRIWICGSFTTVNGSPCTNVARLESNGTLDTSFSLEALGLHGNLWVDLVRVQDDDKVLLAGCWTNPACSLIRLRPDRTLDSSFSGPFADSWGGWSHIYGLATHWDGRIALVGDFRTINGLARNGVAWLLADGGVDTSFNPGSAAEDSIARAVAIDPDGRLVIGGWFSVVRGATRRGLARFNTDGTLDPTLDPGMAIGHTARPNVNVVIRQNDGRYLVAADDWDSAGTNCMLRLLPTGAREADLQVALQVEGFELLSAALQSDGRVLVGGYFTSVQGIARPGLAQFGTDGAVDSSFAPPADLKIEVRAIAIQEDRKILVGGMNTTGFASKSLARLNPDGSWDAAFTRPVFEGQSTMIEKIVVQADGKILVGGLFNTVGGVARSGIARLNTDGSVDVGFVPPDLVTSDDPGYGVEFINVLSNGRILIAGGFRSANDTLPPIARLQADGHLDPTFVPELPDVHPVTAMAVQKDGRILVAGPFQTGEVWGRLLRLLPDGGADTLFHSDVSVGISALALQTDGRILVATNTDHAGTVIRLRSDGTQDGLWQTTLGAPGSYLDTKTLLAVPSGEAIVLGQYQSVGGAPRPSLARLNGDASACYLRVHRGLLATGGFAFQFIGIPRGHFVVETSEDLRAWKTWLDLVDPVSPLELQDSEAAGLTHWFFCARLLP